MKCVLRLSAAFYKELDEKIELVKDQLLERFAIQCSKKKYNFPFLLGEGLFVALLVVLRVEWRI